MAISPAIERRALEKTYHGLMDVIGYRKEKVNGETRTHEEILLRDVPCALSKTYRPRTRQVVDNQVNYVVSYEALLFLAPEVAVPAGSRMVVRQDGVSYVFVQSAEPFVYPTHQEIYVKRLEYV